MNKRGISPIVASVMLILITIAAGLIITQFVIPFVKNNLNRSTECLPFRGYLKFDESLEGNCYTEGKIFIVIKRGNFEKLSLEQGDKAIKDADIAGAQIALSSASETISLKIPSNEIFIKDSTSKESRLPAAGGIVKYETATNTNYNKAQIYVILSNGRVCERPSDEISLTPC